MIFRKAKLGDVPLLLELGDEFRILMEDLDKKDSRHVMQRTRIPHAMDMWKDYIIKKIRANNAQINVCEVDGKIAGFNIINIKKNDVPIFTVKKIGYFGDLYVREKYRKKGIATGFKDMGVKYFRSKGVNDFAISLSPLNTIAHNVYKRWGFFDYQVQMRGRL